MKQKFEQALKHSLSTTNNEATIGRLGEKTLHRVLKHCFEPDETKHEIKIQRYHADIVGDNEIIEIQTRSFNALRSKLSCFLKIKPVRLVYPLVKNKHLVWIDVESGETTKPRKSPKVGKLLDCFYELYKIKPFLTDKNFRLSIIIIDVVEYRNLDGYSKDQKKGSSRNERIPQNFWDVIEINSPKDYAIFLPEHLPTQFTSKDIATLQKMSTKNAGIALNVLHHVGAVKKVGKDRNSILYEKVY